MTIVREPAVVRIVTTLPDEIRLVVAIEVVKYGPLLARLDVVDEQDGPAHDTPNERDALAVGRDLRRRRTAEAFQDLFGRAVAHIAALDRVVEVIAVYVDYRS